MAASAVCRTDHPRACGANFVLSVSGLALCGSSPRVRGKPDCGFIAVKSVRIIPARAGQTKSIAIGGGCYCGPSPRVRGKRPRRAGSTCACRIIPARAGQTLAVRRGSCRRTDHPRACGANIAMITFSVMVSGSSPRVRGKRQRPRKRRARTRIIPARAGQTSCTRWR